MSTTFHRTAGERWKCSGVFLGVLFALHLVRAEIVISNFSTNNPIKVLAVGDSITDDCVVDGAWRKYLQPLLDTNGFPYASVGRILSFPSGGFTKNRHEGYCGAVIAPPGVFGPVHNYSAADNYLQKIVRDVLTNTTPDLVLLLIGANDIGRGRNPHQVATNDMPNLLNIIFSNAPNANVILSKITSLQSASLGYGPYATNVPIYNAALQAMVNQRRALGQNVFLADAFSAVDYNTMFNSDHVHPNVNGLRAIANEFAARIQAICVRTNRIVSTLVHGGDDWKYLAAGTDPGTNWMQLDYDDSGWSNGLGRFGYGDFVSATPVSFGPEPTNKFLTTYFRHAFLVSPDVGITNLNIRLARADGAALWLNGGELFRTNLSAGSLAFSNTALTMMTGYTPYVYFPRNVTVPALPAGTNVIGVEVHLSSPTNWLMGFDLEVIGSGYLIPLPVLSLVLSNDSPLISWSEANGNGFSLYSTTNLAGSWDSVATPPQTNAGTVTVTVAPNGNERFFRLQRPQ
jgi:lysophospholipase L1-like esterase